MRITCILIAALAVLLTIACIIPMNAAEPIGGTQGWISVHGNVDGAQVYFDGTYQGVITGGVLNVGVYSTGTPYTSYSVSKSGYDSYSAGIPYMPGAGETENLYATLNPVVPATTPAVIGGNQGWISVHSNVDGAQVYFDGKYQGVIKGGILTVGVYSTGTPYKSYSVSKNGYASYSANIPYMPSAGETENLYATLNPVVPATTPAVIGGNQGWYTVNCNVNGATVMFDNQVVGTITQGTLTVPVYTTGTPYQTYTVSMNGYLTYTAAMPGVPAAGQTIMLYATLNPAPTSVPVSVVPSVPVPTKSPLPVWICLIGIGIMWVFAARGLRN